MIGSSTIMQNVSVKNMAKTTKTNFSVLITGESGTGKELIAQTIHGYSSRSNAPIHHGKYGITSQRFKFSELFGYERGIYWCG